jgi:hypothetical protein
VPLTASWARIATAATPAARFARKSISLIEWFAGSSTVRLFQVAPPSSETR